MFGKKCLTERKEKKERVEEEIRMSDNNGKRGREREREKVRERVKVKVERLEEGRDEKLNMKVEKF